MLIYVRFRCMSIRSFKDEKDQGGRITGCTGRGANILLSDSTPGYLLHLVLIDLIPACLLE
jgi:hypothetical protein